MNQMKINKEKTKIMLFSRAQSWDFQPNLYIEGNLLDVVEQTKLLGVMISSDLKWSKNDQYIKERFCNKLWMIKRMKEAFATVDDMVEVYKCFPLIYSCIS